MALVLAKPKKRAVHALRTSTRRIEASLALLDELAKQDRKLTLPEKLRAKVVRRLGKVRKAAGRVRDCDVQRGLLKETHRKQGGSKVKHEASELREVLRGERDVEAARLGYELRAHALKLGPLLEELMETLKPVERRQFASLKLMKAAQRWYANRVGATAGGAAALHEVRKTAKLARYMAEHGGAKASAVAEVFERLQESGGSWHDALLLKNLARRKLGKHSALVGVYGHEEQEALAEFQRRLAEQ